MNYHNLALPQNISLHCRLQKTTLHLNARSAVGKKDDITCFINQFSFKFDIIMMTETWYYDGCDMLRLDGYSRFFINRPNRRGGGVCIFVDAYRTHELVSDFSVITDDFEFLTLKTDSEIVAAIYRPPNGNIVNFLNFFESFLEYINSNKYRFVCGGDFNINLLEDTQSTCEFISCLHSSGFTNLISTPTRITITSSSLLDMMITNADTLVSNAGTISSDISDHCPVFMQYSSSKTEKRRQHQTVQVQNITDGSLQAFKRAVSMHDWSFVYMIRDVHEAYLKFIESFTNIYLTHFPFKTFKPSKKIRKPWVTFAIRRLINRKNKLFHAFLKSREEELLQQYKAFRNKLNSALRKAKIAYYEKLFSGICTRYPDAAWKAINSVLGRHKADFMPREITLNNRVLTGALLADSFNKYFTSGIPPVKNTLQMTSSIIRNAESIFLNPADEPEVFRTFMSLKNSSALDIDNLQIGPIKFVLEHLAPVLVYIFNLAVESGEFPREMKCSRVSVLFKGGDKNMLGNYRPISIIPVFAKGFEKMLHSRLSNFFTRSDIISDAQFGFRKGRSTELALLRLKEIILENIENRLFTLGLFIDFTKAFDSIDHSTLLLKLEIYGVRGTPLALIKSYLAERSQCVCLGNHHSSSLPVSRGVPQGSVLGPLLFNVFINDIVNINKSVKFIIYADDATVLFSGADTDRLIESCNRFFCNITSWSLSNKLKINPKKTKVIIFRARNKFLNVNQDIICADQKIDIVEEHKILGVTFSSHLSWDSHVSHLCKKLSFTAGALSRCREILPTQIKVSIYQALFQSHISYCSLVWLTTTQRNINRILVLQKKAVRHIANTGYLSPTSTYFRKYSIIKIQYMYEFRILRSFYICSSSFKQFIELTAALQRNSHAINTRNVGGWLIPRFRTDYKLQSLKYNLPCILKKHNHLHKPALNTLREIFLNY